MENRISSRIETDNLFCFPVRPAPCATASPNQLRLVGAYGIPLLVYTLRLIPMLHFVMKILTPAKALVTTLLFSLAATLPATTDEGREIPNLLVQEGVAFHQLQEAVRKDDPRFRKAYATILAEADEAMQEGPFSVTFKTGTPPSGDVRDYMSIGIFWWPNPDTEDGLPYVRRDGHRNPESRDDTFDFRSNGRMAFGVRRTAMAYALSGEEHYAEHAAKLLRTWFTDPETGMNPNMRYAQAIPGIVDGRDIGIIESVVWVPLMDSANLLRKSPHWTKDDHKALQDWFRQYLHWLQTHPQGVSEERMGNNHGIWYDAQVMAFALFSGNHDAVRRQVQNWTLNRIDDHIDKDGIQVHEIPRATSWHYSQYNLWAHFTVARLAEHAGLDLWNYQSPNGASLRKALDYMLPFIEDPESWPHQQIRESQYGMLINELVPMAIRQWGDEPRYRKAYEALGEETTTSYGRLHYPHFLLRE